MTKLSPHTLFSVYGIEIEYMIVNKNSLDVMPIADKILEKLCGVISSDYEEGPIAVSNELALHVIELKTNGPTPDLSSLAVDFQTMVNTINDIASLFNACLLPTGAHPWFDPQQHFELWPHGDHSIYDTYNRLFGCGGHGWSNLQSTHLNLPFSDEQEFIELYSAIRILLPLLPALAASTPFIEGRKTDSIDARLTYYGKNQAKYPVISGDIVPEPIESIENYNQHILEPIYTVIRQIECNGLLEHEWVNSRGAIARFDRYAIEIRVLDTQECPKVDIALVEFITLLLKEIIQQPHSQNMKNISQATLVKIYNTCIKNGSNAVIDSADYLNIFGFLKNIATAQQLWQELFERVATQLSECSRSIIYYILTQGNLSERLITAYNNDPNLSKIYERLAMCLKKNTVFKP